MENYYSSERNIQIVIFLLKANGIRKVIVSPGATNITIVASMQQDPFFEMYSCVDERSAAYMACGMAEESGEPVVLSCTGATASRDYMPGLTEAFYRKLPIIAITSSQLLSRVGHLVPQVTERTHPPLDTVMGSFTLQVVKDANDEWDCTIKMNKALQLLRRHGGGPVHLNVITTYNRDFSIRELPDTRIIRHILIQNDFPPIKAKQIGIFVGAHHKWTDKETDAIDSFCQKYNGVVFCDHTSNYRGKFRVLASIIAVQREHYDNSLLPTLCVHIGEISGDYPSYWISSHCEVWRVNEDGEIRDTFQQLTHLFEMSEIDFFTHYLSNKCESVQTLYFEKCISAYQSIIQKIPDDLPFSNVWIAQQTAPNLPANSILHLGILNPLKVWNYFETPSSVREYCNVGGFGIDGNASSLIGASLVHQDCLYFGVFGDLSFFYDMNVLGNRHVGKNIRLLIVNNGKGGEFRLFYHDGALFGNKADDYIAAAGHHGNKTMPVLKNYVESLGYHYLSARNKEEFLQNRDDFLSSKITRPIVFEVFTDCQDESDAIYIIHHLAKATFADHTKRAIKAVVGEKCIVKVRQMFK